MSWYVGIDPGNKGAVVVLDKRGRLVEAHMMPTKKVTVNKKNRTVMDVDQIIEMISGWRRGARVTIEKQWARPREGVVQNFSLGVAYATWLVALRCRSIQFQEVAPASWEAALLRPFGKNEGKGKPASCAAAKQIIPELSLRPGRMRTDHDGLADAALVAVYGRENLEWD